MSKGFFMHKKCFISVRILKFSTLLITYQESVVARNLPASRSNLERHPSSRGDSGIQSTAMQKVQWTLYCPLLMELDNWLIIISAYRIQILVSSKIALSSTVFKWAPCPNQSFGYCAYLSPLNPLWVRCSHHNQTHPLWQAQGVNTSELQGKKIRLVERRICYIWVGPCCPRMWIISEKR